MRIDNISLVEIPLSVTGSELDFEVFYFSAIKMIDSIQVKTKIVFVPEDGYERQILENIRKFGGACKDMERIESVLIPHTKVWLMKSVFGPIEILTTK